MLSGQRLKWGGDVSVTLDSRMKTKKEPIAKREEKSGEKRADVNEVSIFN